MINSTGALSPPYNISSAGPDDPSERRLNWPVLCFFLISLGAITGNVLVCLAVKFERKLRNMFNFFLVSLAMSDMMSAVLVMPVSIIKSFLVDLHIPKIMCVTWYSLDVLFTSSTIIHLTMISVDRYMSLKYPLKYGHAKKTKHMILKILLVWVLSFCIAGPLFMLTMFDPQVKVSFKGCGPETTSFVLSATITSFYLPLLIMGIMYILTVKALIDQRKAQKKLSLANTAASTWSLREGVSTGLARNSLAKQGSTDSRDCANNLGGRSPLLGRKSQQKSPESSPGHNQVEKRASAGAGNYLCVENSATLTNGQSMSPSSTCTDIALQEFDTEIQIQHNNSKKLKIRTFHFKREKGKGSSRRSLADKGKRAVQVLGILFMVFLTFYLPFFLTYTINHTCMACRKHISEKMLTAFEWLQYSGSMVNPIVYHIFNPEFRRVFHRLIRGKCRRRRGR